MQKRLLLIITFIICSLVHQNHAADKTIILNDSISIYLTEDSIDYKTYFRDYEHIELLDDIWFIDNIPVYGIDNEPPNTVVSELILIKSRKKTYLDRSYMYQPHLLLLTKEDIEISITDDLITLTIPFSDGAGSYAAQWVIFGNQSTRIIITSNEDIYVSMFKKWR